jgi:hypothetical protein
VACLFVPVLTGSNVLAVNVSSGACSNDVKVPRGRGSETAAFPVFLHSNAKNLQIVWQRFKNYAFARNCFAGMENGTLRKASV